MSVRACVLLDTAGNDKTHNVSKRVHVNGSVLDCMCFCASKVVHKEITVASFVCLFVFF